MPYTVEKGHGCSGSKPFALIKSATGEKVACHATKEAAEAQMKAIMAKEGHMYSGEAPKTDLVRAITPGYELREDDGGGMPTLHGHFAVFNEWTEIHSVFEGDFMERFHPNSMTRTFNEERDRMRVLFQHGRDPQIGDKPLGPIATLEAKRSGAYYEVPLLDTQYNRELLPGLRAGLYGASFRFSVDEESWNKKPERSEYNPEGLPERTVMGASVKEFGPVTFPAYAKATAGVRSLTDEFHVFTGRSEPWRPDGGDFDAQPGNGEASIPQQLRNRDRLLRVLGVLRA